MYQPSLSSFIANAHNKLYTFYTGKGGFLTKNSEPMGGGAAPSLESATNTQKHRRTVMCLKSGVLTIHDVDDVYCVYSCECSYSATS